MSRSHPAAAHIRRFTHGLCDTIIDFLLFELYFTALFLAHGKTRSPRWIDREADRILDQCDAQTVRRAMARLRERGFIETIRGSPARARVTMAGQRWSSETFPTYHARRPWDRRLYLITYDVPERLAYVRQQLREFLRRIRCGMLQASVWVTPYRPRKLLETFVREHRIPGVIVSEFGRGSVIGEGTYRDVVALAYGLPELNARYTSFLSEYRRRPDARPLEVAAAYAAILRDDAQLPFELLPPEWRGDEAYGFVRRRFRTINHLRGGRIPMAGMR